MTFLAVLVSVALLGCLSIFAFAAVCLILGIRPIAALTFPALVGGITYLFMLGYIIYHIDMMEEL